MPGIHLILGPEKGPLCLDWGRIFGVTRAIQHVGSLGLRALQLGLQGHEGRIKYWKLPHVLGPRRALQGSFFPAFGGPKSNGKYGYTYGDSL